MVKPGILANGVKFAARGDCEYAFALSPEKLTFLYWKSTH